MTQRFRKAKSGASPSPVDPRGSSGPRWTGGAEAAAARLESRLHGVQQVMAALVRSLDRGELERELVAQVAPLFDADLAVLAAPGAEGEAPHIAIPASVDEAIAARIAPALGEVKATGRPTRRQGEDWSLIAAPILVGYRLEGVLVAYAARARAFDGADEELVRTVARVAAMALVNATLYAASEQERRAAAAAVSVATAMGASLCPGEVLRLALRQAMGLLRVEGAIIMLRRDGLLHVVAAEGTAHLLEGLVLPVERSVSGRSVRDGVTVTDNAALETRSAHPMVRAHLAVRNVMVTPLPGPDGPIGAIAALNRDRPFDQEDARSLERLAAQVSVALVNARLYEEADAARTELTAAFDAMAGALAVVDGEGRIVRHNARLVALSGAAGGAALEGRSVYEVLLHEPRPCGDSTTALGRALLDGESACETLAPGWSGRQLVLAAAPYPAGGAVVTVEDVTDVTRARAAAAAADLRYRELIDAAADVIVTVDANGLITSVNAAVERVLGYAGAELVGTSMSPLVDPADVSVLERSFRRCLDGTPTRFEARVRHRDGGWRIMEIADTPIREGGRVVGALGVARDVTDDRARQSALERAESRFTRLVEAAEDAIVIVDAMGTITEMNPAFSRVLAQPREALVGRHFAAFIDPSEQAQLWPVFLATIAGERRRAEVQYRARRDGRPRVSTVVTAPMVEEGRITGGIAVFRDVTEERRLLEGLARSDKLVSLGELVGGVAHEVSAPLTSILTHAELLASGGLPAADAMRAASSVASEARRAARLVGKLLGYARPSAHARAATDLPQVVRDVLELRRHPLQMRQAVVDVVLPDGLPPVWADPFELQQVFMNLLANAEHAVSEVPEGSRRIGVRVSVVGDELVAVVEDSGRGVAAAHLPHLFAPFYTTKPRGAGTGLGLSIVAAIVREHGGQVRLQPRDGGGAAFEVRLPVHRPAEGP